MNALPYPTAPTTPAGQPDGPGQAGQAGQPDVGYTPAMCPVFIFNFAYWATLYLVTVHHAGELRHSWVYGSPQRLVDLAARIGVRVSVEWRAEIDEHLPAVQLLR